MAKNSIPAAMDCIHFYGRSVNTIHVKLLKILILSFLHLQPLIVNFESLAGTNMAMSKIHSFKNAIGANYIKKICSLKTPRSSKEKLSQSVSVKTRFFFSAIKKPIVHTNVFFFFANYARYT